MKLGWPHPNAYIAEPSANLDSPMSAYSSDEISRYLREFNQARDGMLGEDAETFIDHAAQFLRICDRNPLLSSILAPILQRQIAITDSWWSAATAYRGSKTSFPDDPDEDIALRYHLLQEVVEKPSLLFSLAIARGRNHQREGADLFRSIVIRELMEQLGLRIADAANIAIPEARTVQAVPLNRIPQPTEVKIFLSHKTVDKDIVRRYHQVLKALGFAPWLDVEAMPAGSNVSRSIYAGIEQACAAVFFLTPNYNDERFLADEIDYALGQKREKGNKFALIPLRFGDAKTPKLLRQYAWQDVENDLDGLHAIVRAVPIELGPVRWKEHVVRSE